ncbi:hypothetical protein GCM10010357_67100 [Streptomyces luteireticuli]|uniref:Uncharacterized protein n=1 Tax=Streptomyces luteireticuli TaxID=173858 RepID=A0ABP3J2U7_9ACTN
MLSGGAGAGPPPRGPVPSAARWNGGGRPVVLSGEGMRGVTYRQVTPPVGGEAPPRGTARAADPLLPVADAARPSAS